MKWKRMTNLSQYRQYIYVFAIGVVLLLLTNTPVFKMVLGGLQTFTIPVQTAFYQGFKGIGNTFSTLVQIGSLRKENSALEIENAVLKSENLRLKNLEKENENLRKQLGTPPNDLKIFASARPVGKGVFGSKSVLEIDRGSADKVKNGDIVVFQNILLGQVIAVTARVSSVQLLSDPDTKIPVLTESGAEGILVGQFGSGINIVDVTQEKLLNPGDLVYTSGKGSYPKGLVVGAVGKVNKVEKELFQKASVNQLVNPENLELVYLISL